MKKTKKTPKPKEHQLSLLPTAKDAKDFFAQFKAQTPITPEIWENFCQHMANKGAH